MPPNFGITCRQACPAVIRALLGSDEVVDARALDVWSLGSMLVRYYGDYEAWKPSDPDEEEQLALFLLHNQWVGGVTMGVVEPPDAAWCKTS